MPRGLRIVIAVLIAASLPAACATSRSATPTGRTVSREAGPSPATPTPTGAETLPPSTSDGPNATRVPTPNPPATGTGIAGVTIIDGHCPVMTDQPCPDRPIKTHLSIIDTATGAVVASLDSGTDGRFSVATKPGRYTVRPQNVAGALPRGVTAMDVTVQPGHYTTITLRFFSGVR